MSRSSPSRQSKSLKPDRVTSVRMANIRQKGTDIESLVAVTLRRLGQHYRKNVRGLPGSPDFANRSGRWAIFVNGCFWHHHTACTKATVPKSNVRFWVEKFHANRRRDAVAIRRLRTMGYKVAILWECERGHIDVRLRKILESRGIDRR